MDTLTINSRNRWKVVQYRINSEIIDSNDKNFNERKCAENDSELGDNQTGQLDVLESKAIYWSSSQRGE